MDLRIANAQMIVNYAAFLEENKYYEESFKVNNPGTLVFRANSPLIPYRFMSVVPTSLPSPFHSRSGTSTSRSL